MNVGLLIARRLSLKRDSGEPNGPRRSPAVTIAVAGIALSITIMLLTLAIVPGFKHQITRKVMGFDAQVTMHPVRPTADGFDGAPLPTVAMTPELDRMIGECLPDGAVAELTIKQPGILKTDNQFAGLVFKAFDGDMADSFVQENLEEGGIPDYECDSMRYHIVISRATADALELERGDKVNGYFFTDNNLRTRRFTVAGIYNSHFNEYDKLLAFMSMDAARGISGIPDGEGTAIEIRGLASDDIEESAYGLQHVATDAFYGNATNCYLAVNDVYEINPMYFNWLDLLDTNVVVILVLMGCVAAVTLISCLFIMILERVNLIGTLKALGADNGLIARTFLYMAERVVLRGIIIGDIVGLALVWLQWQFKLMPLDPEAYYLNSVPVEFNWTGIVILNIAAAALALAIMLIPTHTVARISPARVMRFE